RLPQDVANPLRRGLRLYLSFKIRTVERRDHSDGAGGSQARLGTAPGKMLGWSDWEDWGGGRGLVVSTVQRRLVGAPARGHGEVRRRRLPKLTHPARNTGAAGSGQSTATGSTGDSGSPRPGRRRRSRSRTAGPRTPSTPRTAP